MQTQDFATKTLMIDKPNINIPGCWPIALDIGYSGVKGMSPNRTYCFPSFAKKMTRKLLSVNNTPNDIYYKDEEGERWSVGSRPQLGLSKTDTNESLETLFGRHRYYSEMFKVIARTGIALGMIDNAYGEPGNRELYLQTGLPPAYLKSDSRVLREVLSGHHEFSLQVGNSKWIDFSFDLPEDHIRIMSQPMGSLLSSSMDDFGRQLPEADQLFNSNVLIFDAGFGTVDIFSVRQGEIEPAQSFDNMGMKAVFMDVSDKIYEKYGTEIPVHTMQKDLQNGYIYVTDSKTVSNKAEPFADILEECSTRMCQRAIKRLNEIYNNLMDYDYLLITGGTGAAWENQIREYYKGMTSLTIISGRVSEELPHIFSNVRGYYLYQVALLSKHSKKA